MPRSGLPGLMMNLLLAAALFGPPAAAQGPPDAIPELHWVSAARVLDGDAPDTLHPRSRKLIDEQSEKFLAEFGSAARHGLREGRLAPEEFCTVKGIGGGAVYIAGDGAEFGSALLLSEVAVVATVTDIIPGFSYGPLVESLLELGDVVPLHERSPIPGYVLVPARRVVAEDRVFCGGDVYEYDPVIGTRVVVIGPWVEGVVPVGLGPTNLFATVQKDGESLRWLVEGQGAPAPGNLLDLQARVDEAVRGNLFTLTAGLVKLEEWTKKRRRFGREWQRRTHRGCRLIAVDEANGAQTEICIDPKTATVTAPARDAGDLEWADYERRIAALRRFERAWWQQCADGGTPPFVEVVSGNERSRLDVCER
ncbi:MAG: hypothetical protein OXG74_10325 [Acidobacteria bacterium]|nr:hypothetical protein [Acidobacteriota bacterium]